MVDASLHLLRCGHAQQAQAVGQDGADAVGQLQAGGQDRRLLTLDAAGPVEAVEIPGQLGEVAVDAGGVVVAGGGVDLLRQTGQGCG